VFYDGEAASVLLEEIITSNPSYFAVLYDFRERSGFRLARRLAVRDGFIPA
jgi:hypothetical protein